MEKEPFPQTQDSGVDIQSMKTEGYSTKAIRYYTDRPCIGALEDADQVTELTGPCGDSITVYLKMKEGCVTQAKAMITGCPGAITSAMAAMELVQGKTLSQALSIGEIDIFNTLGNLPDEKLECVQLSAKVLHMAIEDYVLRGPTVDDPIW